MGNALETITIDLLPITSPLGVLSRLRLVAIKNYILNQQDLTEKSFS
jgi:hypothetical protein